MRSDIDGGLRGNDRPKVTFIVYGRIDEATTTTVYEALESYFSSIEDYLAKFPSLVHINRKIPEIRTSQNQQHYYFKDMNNLEGNIKIGLTEGELYSPADRRNIFGYGNHDGSGIFSLARFRKDYSNRRLFYNRIEKESIKILSLALQVSSCPTPNCIISYHRHVEDLDTNNSVCPKCQKEIIMEINDYLNPSGAKNMISGSLL